MKLSYVAEEIFVVERALIWAFNLLQCVLWFICTKINSIRVVNILVTRAKVTSHGQKNVSINIKNMNIWLLLSFWTLSIVQKLNSNECYTPSSEPFRMYMNIWYLMATHKTSTVLLSSHVAMTSVPQAEYITARPLPDMLLLKVRKQSHLCNRPWRPIGVLPVRYEYHLGVKKYSYPCNRLWGPVGFWEVEDLCLDNRPTEESKLSD
jgi:hypothetical protein